MKTVSVEIKIPDGHEIIECPKVDSSWISSGNSKVICFSVRTTPSKPFLIDGVPSDWPEWLKCDWVSKEDDGEIYFHYSEPRYDGSNWICSGGSECINKSIIAIDIPGPCEQSLRENPRRKK